MDNTEYNKLYNTEIMKLEQQGIKILSPQEKLRMSKMQTVKRTKFVSNQPDRQHQNVVKPQQVRQQDRIKTPQPQSIEKSIADGFGFSDSRPAAKKIEMAEKTGTEKYGFAGENKGTMIDNFFK